MKPASKVVYPSSGELGIPIPTSLMPERFEAGFQHALHGGQIREASQLRRSFGAGYRAGKLYLRALRRQQGIVEFPLMGKLRVRSRPH